MVLHQVTSEKRCQVCKNTVVAHRVFFLYIVFAKENPRFGVQIIALRGGYVFSLHFINTYITLTYGWGFISATQILRTVRVLSCRITKKENIYTVEQKAKGTPKTTLTSSLHKASNHQIFGSSNQGYQWLVSLQSEVQHLSQIRTVKQHKYILCFTNIVFTVLHTNRI